MARPPPALLAAVLLALCLLAYPRSAEAHSWMIRHQYAGCSMCHTDPSGAGLLTPYGRAQGELLLRTRYGAERDAEEPGKAGEFLLGVVTLPDWLLLGGNYRGMYVLTHPRGGRTDQAWLNMQADVAAHVSAGPIRAYGSVGYAQSGALGAVVAGNLVSREHWLGAAFGDETYLVRAGRIMLPFGLRIIEHTLWVRQATRTDINAAQQHGVAFAWSAERWRGELMAIAGNFQTRPDAFRERGYSGYVDWSVADTVSLGASSLVTHAREDFRLLVANTRQAHGLFARAAPVHPLVVSVEADYVHEAPEGMPSASGHAGLLSLDLEAIQGLHLMSAVETRDRGRPGERLSLGGWLSGAWFFAPHADLRLDVARHQVSSGGALVGITTVLGQVHVFL
jgi:hypothetical protein